MACRQAFCGHYQVTEARSFLMTSGQFNYNSLHFRYENTSTDILLTQKPLILCVAYRPQYNHTFWQRLDQSVEQALDVSSKITIVGDINENLLSRSQLNSADLMERKNLYNVIKEPTRVTRTTTTLLDPVIVSDDVSVRDSGVAELDKKVSDHRGTYISLGINATTKNVFY